MKKLLALLMGVLVATVCFAQSDQIVIRARGTMGGENLELRLNGNSVNSWTMSTSYTDYSASGSGEVEIHFTNDDQAQNGMDIQVDYINYHGTVLQAEDQAVNTGVYVNDSCGGSYSDMLHCDGYILFDTSSIPGPTGMLGDVNGDETISIVDALMTAQYYVGLNPAGFDPGQADVDCNSSITIVDALQIAQYYVGLLSVFPCPTPSPTPVVTPTPATPTPSSGSCDGVNGNVYLTFDDGPNGNTGTIVNSLVSAGACKATFFVIGQNMPGNSAAYKNAGFSVQNHSYTHPHMGSYSYQQVQNELQQCNTAIQNAGFPQPVAIRLPYLENSSTIQSVCSSLGLQIISPSVDTQDWNGASTQSIISVASNLSAGQNPLMHENQSNTVAAVSTIVQNLKNRGLGFAQY